MKVYYTINIDLIMRSEKQMIEKAVAINILEEISQCLDEENWQARTLNTAKQYKKGLIIATDVELKVKKDGRTKNDTNFR
jgi:hypothetical protein